MKKLFVILSMICFTVTYAQTESKETELSNAERFSAKDGTLIQKVFIEVGTIKGAEFKIIHYTDLVTGETLSSLRIEYETGGTYSDTKIAALDSDEIEGLLKSLDIMQSKVFATIPLNYTEVSYRSRGGFEAGCFWSKGDWSTYLKLEKFDGKSYVFLKKEDFPELQALIRKVKEEISK